jgi:GAF domain-containing protein
VRSLLAVPLVGRRTDHGWLCLTNRIAPGAFTVDDAKIAVTLAAQTVLAYESLTMARELEEKVVSLSGT